MHTNCITNKQKFVHGIISSVKKYLESTDLPPQHFLISNTVVLNPYSHSTAFNCQTFILSSRLV